jgi:hypothetical protein
VGARQLFWEQLCFCSVVETRTLIFGVGKIIVIYYTSGLNECLTSDAFNSTSGEAASALTSQVKHSFSPRV